MGAAVRAFTAVCPACGSEGPFLPVRIEKAVITQEARARGERPAFEGFRCMSCHKIAPEVLDVEGKLHRWRGGAVEED